MGSLKFVIAVSARQCKLDISLCNQFYVKVADVNDCNGQGQDDEAIEAFTNCYAAIAPASSDITDFEEDMGEE